MKVLAWLLAPTLTILLGVPLAAALVVTTIAIPALAAPTDAPCVTTNDGQPTLMDALPPVGSPRRASLTNPPTPIPVRLERSRFGGGWDMFRGFLILGGTDDGIDTEGVYGGVQSVSGRVRVE